MTKIKYKLSYKYIVYAYWLALFIANHVPISFELDPNAHQDKWFHFLSFSVLAGLLYWLYRVGLDIRKSLFLVLGLAIYAAIDEVLQIPFGRHADVADWLADCTGVVVAVLLFNAIEGYSSLRARRAKVQ